MHYHTPPYDTGKVKIGLLYRGRPHDMTRDEERIQAALLGIRPDWCYIIEGAIIYVALVSLLFSAIFFLLIKD
jgi:hypothetical protein